MARFIGTSASETITYTYVSPTVSKTAPFTSNAVDEVLSYAGNDFIATIGGNDEVFSGLGNDTIYGGLGNDILYGENGQDSIYGEGGNDTINGGADYDFLYGGDGDDAISGGSYFDDMFGGKGNDKYYVDHAADWVIEYYGEGVDTIYSSVSFSIGYVSSLGYTTQVENITLQGSGRLNAYGNNLNNALTGNNGANVLEGYDGNDALFGGGGNDTLNGGKGVDTLRGQAGADTLAGALGSDILIGGTGNDVFRFLGVAVTTLSYIETDVVRAGDGAGAFEKPGGAAGDKFDLKDIDADFTLAGNQTFKFGGVGKGFLSVRNLGANTEVVGNVDGDSAFEFRFLIEDGQVSASAYTAADFIL